MSRIRRSLPHLGLFLLLLVHAGCSRQGGIAEAKKTASPVVYTVNYPLQYFAHRIAGDAVDVVFPAVEGDPAYWQPAAEDVAAYQRADLILLNGAGYAGWVSKVTLPPSKLVDTGSRFKDQWIPMEAEVTHVHGPTGKHTHGAFAFTTWLDPRLAVEQARAIRDAFVRTWPDKQQQFDLGYASLEHDLLALDTDLQELFSRAGAIPLVMSHPVYQYLERRYGVSARSVHWEPDVLPDPRMMAELKTLLADHPAKWMIWEAQPDPKSVALLKELGVSSAVVEPCANKPAEGDFLSRMRANLANLGQIVAKP